MAKRRRKRNAFGNPALTHTALNRLTKAQREALIPGGPVNPHRASRDEIIIETRADSKDGRALIMGQQVSTPVRKLLEAGLITLEEMHGAQLFQRDFDIAYASCINPLARVIVDSSSSGAASKGAMDRKAFHGERYRRARLYLGSELSRVALAGIIESPDAGIDPTFTGIGADVLVGCTKQQQREGGRWGLVIVCRMLAVFYGARNADRSRIRVQD